jgi:3(or 17)beta-hydroxysteroid dehydrogenase
MQRLAGNTALVTGGASGLGHAIAIRLRAEGAQVIISDIQTDLGRKLASQHDLTFRMQDVCNEAGWSETITAIESQFGRLDILVNNAGILGPVESADPETTPLELWRKIFTVNVESVFLGCRAGIRAMRRTGGGSIINMSSVAGLLAVPSAAAYAASKAAVRSLTKAVAQHCAENKLNIRCNSVHPGDVMTPLWDKAAEGFARARGITPQEVIAQERRLSPLGDFPKPEDIAAAVAYLASSDARFVTGDGLIVDGGVVHCDTFHPSPASG